MGAETDGPAVTVPLGQGIAGTIAATVSPPVIDDLSMHEVAVLVGRHHAFAHGGAARLPRKVTGLIHVAGRTPRSFTPDEVELLELAANRIASALESAALNDNRAAMSQALQRSLAPTALPEIEGIDLAATYRPFAPGAKIGGDFYDVFPHGDGTWGIAIGDVSGKGPGAAAVMGLAAHTIRALARYETRPSAVLTALNDALLEGGTGGERAILYRLRDASAPRRRPAARHAVPRGASDAVPRPSRRPRRAGRRSRHPTRLVPGPGAPRRRGRSVAGRHDRRLHRRARRTTGPRHRGRETALSDVLSSCAGRSSETILERIQTVMVDQAVVDDDIAIVVVRKR